MEGVDEDLRRVLGDAFAREGAVQWASASRHRDARLAIVKAGKSARSRGSGQAMVGHICRCNRLDAYSGLRFRPRARRGRTANTSSTGSRGVHNYFGEQYGHTRTTTAGRAPAERRFQRRRRVAGALRRHRSGDGIEALRRRHACPDMLNAAPVLTEHPPREVPGHRDDRSRENAGRGPESLRRRTFLDIAARDLPLPICQCSSRSANHLLQSAICSRLVVADTMFHAA